MRDKYGAGQDRYCYPDTDVLINLLNIRDGDELAEAETAFTAERYRTYKASKLSLHDFTLSHLKGLHYHLFQDVFAWAGKIRDVDISKGNTRFCNCARILPEADKLFCTIPGLGQTDNHWQFVAKLADLFCELNLLHPFREGNGRVQRFFFEELLFTLGYEVIWPSISQQQWIDANVAGVNLNLAPLEKIFSEAITSRYPT